PAEARSRLEVCLFWWPWSRSPDVHRAAARAARLTGDYSVAESHLQRCIKLENGATERTQLEFLLMRAQTGEEDEVDAPLSALVSNKHPEAPLILETLARAYMHRLRYGPAYYHLTRWLEMAPEAAKAYHWRGWVLERVNSHKLAMQ